MGTSLDVAQLDIDDVKIAVVFLNRPTTPAAYVALERAAKKAGLEGEIAAVWSDEHGRTRFVARPELHAFFQAVGYDQLLSQINAKLELG